MYIADTFNNRIRKVTVSTGIITTIAGIGTASYSGDNGQAIAATLNNPSDVVIDSTGTADHVHHTHALNFIVQVMCILLIGLTTVSAR